MSEKFQQLSTEINQCFYEIVGIINEIIAYRTESFSGIVTVGEDIQKGSEKFVTETDSILGSISDQINSKIENLNMQQMQDDIREATGTFIEITEELELLSYNTICRTMALGEKGATITHISKEIKKYASTVKDLLEIISKCFSEMFAKFKEVADSLMENRLIPAENSFNVEAIEEIVITSDVSILIENSQFHDIYMQELEVINDVVSNNDYSNAYEAGLIFGVYEKAMTRMDYIKHSLEEKLEEIKGVMGDFMYIFNTDLQNMASKTNILRTELSRVGETAGEICSSLHNMSDNVNNTKGVLTKTRGSVDMLSKQTKTFRSLVVITAVEVARINDESLRSVVVSMNETENELNKLIDKLHNNIDMWEALRENFVSAFIAAESDMNSVCHADVAKDREKILGQTKELDVHLTDFRDVFHGDKYLNFFSTTTGRLVELFYEYSDSVQMNFTEFNESLSDEILSSEEFTQGRNDADFKDVLANEDEQSSVEFF